jgi:hypothetical protein
MEGNEEQRRKTAREARAHGKLPSEVSGTLGASKQTKHAKHSKGTHEERIAQRSEGKANRAQASGPPRPGSREHDPKRTDRWG